LSHSSTSSRRQLDATTSFRDVLTKRAGPLLDRRSLGEGGCRAMQSFTPTLRQLSLRTSILAATALALVSTSHDVVGQAQGQLAKWHQWGGPQRNFNVPSPPLARTWGRRRSATTVAASARRRLLVDSRRRFHAGDDVSSGRLRGGGCTRRGERPHALGARLRCAADPRRLFRCLVQLRRARAVLNAAHRRRPGLRRGG